MLSVRNIQKTFGHRNQHTFHAVSNVELNVKRGEFVGIMGPSGAGKTTLLNILATIDKPTSGSVVIDGEDIIKLKEKELAQFRRKKLGFIFQDYHLLDTMTVKENIILPLALGGTRAKEIEERVTDLMVVLGIDSIADQYPYQLSGGQKQRTAAARAIIAKPSLVLADEPTGSLDSKSASELLHTLSLLNSDYQTTILMVTHDTHAASFCNRVIFMKDGQLFTELGRGDKERRDYYKQLLNTIATLGGGSYDTY